LPEEHAVRLLGSDAVSQDAISRARNQLPKDCEAN